MHLVGPERRLLPSYTNQEIMEILEAFDLTRSYRAAAQLSGTDHRTVAHYIEWRRRLRPLPPGPPPTACRSVCRED